MAQVLVRNIDDEVIARLKRRAEQQGRSLQAELKHILVQAVKTDRTKARRLAQMIRRNLSNGSHSDSGVLVAEDRER